MSGSKADVFSVSLVSDIQSRKPSFDELQVEVMVLSEEILQEIFAEPSFTPEGQQKKSVVVQLLQSMETDNWNQFLSTAGASLLEILSEPKKVLPVKNFDENVRALNALLADEEFMQGLCDALNIIVDNDSPAVMTRIVFRFLSRMFFKLNQHIFNKMKRDFSDQPSSSSSVMQEREKSSFILIINDIVRDQLKRRIGSSQSFNCNFASALRNKFVVTEEDLGVKEFLEPQSWIEDEDGCLKIKLSDHALQFFFGLENMFRSKPVSEVNFDLLLQAEAEGILNSWSCLTEGFLNENEGLYFLEEIFNTLFNISMKLESEKQCREWKQKNKEQKHALRTGLKRN